MKNFSPVVDIVWPGYQNNVRRVPGKSWGKMFVLKVFLPSSSDINQKNCEHLAKVFSATLSKQHYICPKDFFEKFSRKSFLLLFEKWTNEIRLRRTFLNGVSKNIFYKSIGTICEETFYSKKVSLFHQFRMLSTFFPTFFRNFFAGVVKSAFQVSIHCISLTSSDIDWKQFGLPAEVFWQG